MDNQGKHKGKINNHPKRTLRKYDYQPDLQKLATETVLKQAELILVAFWMLPLVTS